MVNEGWGLHMKVAKPVFNRVPYYYKGHKTKRNEWYNKCTRNDK